MTISLTWANYALIVSVFLAIYYAVVIYLCYRVGSRFATASKENVSAGYTAIKQNDVIDTKNKNLFGEPVIQNNNKDRTNFNPEAQNFADEIVAYTSSCDDGITKEKLIAGIKQIIKKYPSLTNDEHRYKLNQLIIISTENYCSIHMSAYELSELWRE